MSPATTPAAASPAIGLELEHAWAAEALRSVWERQRPVVGERIAVIEAAVAALAQERLDPKLRADATRAAHMLAGSVGMFGFMDASEAAHELEAALAQAGPERAPELAAGLRRLRDGVAG
jgi:chemotaxis protein histidine kinase CheA